MVEDHQALIGDAVINNGPGLMLIVEKLPWGNTLEVTEGVEAALDEMKPGLTGIDIDTTIFRPASFIEESLGQPRPGAAPRLLAGHHGAEVFLFQWRTALISLVAIPLSLVTAALVLYWTGGSINTMVLAGLVIAVGVVVDDAIIDIENIVRRLRQHRASGSTDPQPGGAGGLARGARTYRLCDVDHRRRHVPIFFLDGLTGAFFRPLAISYTLAVLASMVVALTVTPALASSSSETPS